ncbi:unnamed protein product [Musa acuminata subsp. malaccensis]|uniref:(wild Malaysian banana) hypothetical protein n=1 Tax=Musa acuminata subsp. malaccensis TaxID=214687 RepID=A0A804HP82_MUSAM|nr:unnamed protein product [Musa acuminata subsp. malaccensis]
MRSPSQGGREEGRGGLANTFGCFRGEWGLRCRQGGDSSSASLPLAAACLVVVSRRRWRRQKRSAGRSAATEKAHLPTLLSFLRARQPHPPPPPPTVAAPPPRLFLPAPCPEIEKRSFVNTLEMMKLYLLSMYNRKSREAGGGGCDNFTMVIVVVAFVRRVEAGSGCLQVSFRQRERRPSLLLSISTSPVHL